ncbi:hypothetical protein GCM10022222_17800 [Amycolatopsis ultiminotia]|uniref:Uncharacterized protein n=1 Tax=Amycolatopsis ultiminotia TaxID=543629 RepID=A0ABP6VF64_9PSEU
MSLTELILTRSSYTITLMPDPQPRPEPSRTLCASESPTIKTKQSPSRPSSPHQRRAAPNGAKQPPPTLTEAKQHTPPLTDVEQPHHTHRASPTHPQSPARTDSDPHAPTATRTHRQRPARTDSHPHAPTATMLGQQPTAPWGSGGLGPPGTTQARHTGKAPPEGTPNRGDRRTWSPLGGYAQCGSSRTVFHKGGSSVSPGDTECAGLLFSTGPV